MSTSHWSKPRQRVRLLSVQTDTTPDSRCRVEVELEWVGGTRVQGSANGNATREGALIAASLAAIEAITDVAGDRLRIEFRGAKAVRAFDALVAIVALRAEARGRRYDLLGCCAAPDDEVARGGVLAVLDATNRVLERYADLEEPPSRQEA